MFSDVLSQCFSNWVVGPVAFVCFISNPSGDVCGPTACDEDTAHAVCDSRH